MSRHKENLSFYYVKNKLLYFTLEFKILYDSNKFHSIVIEPKSQKDSIKTILTESPEIVKLTTDLLLNNNLNFN